MPMKEAATALLGDLGGTNARFGILDLQLEQQEPRQMLTLRCADHPTVLAAIDEYLIRSGNPLRPAIAVLAAAGPVTHGSVKFTNNPWHCSEAELQAHGFTRARLLNDFEALGYAAQLLVPADLQSLGGPATGTAGGSLAVLGPGTGFGLVLLARDAHCSVVLPTEAGNAAFAPNDALEVDLLRVLGARLGRVTIESILSGPGLLHLHDALCVIHDAQSVATTPASVTELARQGDRLAALTLQHFCAILGSVAGDIAITTGTRGGVYVTGGVADTLAEELLHSRFRSRFDDKGRYRDYVSAIPTARIARAQPAFLGAALVARRMAADMQRS